eukprot:CAMPEP_0184742880 /NCGR_PEP_ID=MMETSP0315-20130426/5830_1 /TAXON_ID=101924 /ORGANISM="Rhodosorus marinus, Strain UTEX LB 2760" /LENGTH=155 /DNA_ID=CAMNT_0027213939 /DNA_START=143 /DNA_END=608 /DNA_ORIENTATION=-
MAEVSSEAAEFVDEFDDIAQKVDDSDALSKLAESDAPYPRKDGNATTDDIVGDPIWRLATPVLCIVKRMPGEMDYRPVPLEFRASKNEMINDEKIFLLNTGPEVCIYAGKNVRMADLQYLLNSTPELFEKARSKKGALFLSSYRKVIPQDFFFDW